jgi:hypothetical protein
VGQRVSATGPPASLTVKQCVLDGNGVLTIGATLTVEDTVVRHSRGSDTLGGVGIEAQALGTAPAPATISRCLVEDAQAAGIQTNGADATVSGTIVRDTVPDPTGYLGFGMVFAAQDAKNRGTITVTASLLERNLTAGVLAAGVDLTFDRSESSHNLQRMKDGRFGDGLAVSDLAFNGAQVPVVTTITSSAFRDNFEEGVVILGGTATLTGVVVTGTKASATDGTLGDGISVVGTAADPVSATLTSVELSGNQRSGVANFGGSVTLQASALSCNGFDLDAEPGTDGQAATYDDQGGNTCGCQESTVACKALGASLAPPSVPAAAGP